MVSDTTNAASRGVPMPGEQPGCIRVGRQNPHTLYWAPEGSSPRDAAEEPIGCAFTPEWAKRIAALSDELGAAQRVIAGMQVASDSLTARENEIRRQATEEIQGGD